MTPTLMVRFYATARGAEPVRTWLKDLPAEARKSIGEDIKTVQFGWPIGMPLVRKLAPELWEVRSDVAAGIARVFFTVTGGNMVLVHGFVKKSQKTPTSELEIAKARTKEIHSAS